MESMVVTSPDDLDRVPVWDAWFDSDEVVHDAASRTLTVRFAQERGPADDVPPSQVVGRSGLSKVHRMAFLDWYLVIHNVVGVRAEDGWADMRMLEGLTFDVEQQELSIQSNGVMSVAVEGLHLEARLSPERIRWMRRRVGLLGWCSDSPWRTPVDAP